MYSTRYWWLYPRETTPILLITNYSEVTPLLHDRIRYDQRREMRWY
jgi:hypothetical protein